ncbi:hypothetical protein [Promicromonospora kroppenstedtii]|uniref:hypothetical protein n=1 Tax=Promicromonospora kroppenstedtii TaxID=440482 RepID=UPI0004B02FF6|nr:hypothetical protein [Promicromonospora kroppenstedtii]
MSSVSHTLLDGQVNVDADAEVTRSAPLTFLDPSHSLNFDTDSPDDGAIYADRMIRVRYGVHVEELDRYVFATVFTGPVTGLSREGVTVTVEAQGKEALALGAVWTPITLRKGMTVVGAIRVLMSSRAGETRFSIPDFRNSYGKRLTLPKARSLDRFAQVWSAARSLSRSIDKQLFYNGAGILVMRNHSRAVKYVFKPGTGGSIVSEVAINYQMADVKNTISVKGQPPNGKMGAVSATVVAPRSHPLSPFRMGREGAPRYLVERVENASIRSHAAAKEYAERLLESRIREAVEVSFDALPVPHLDPDDMVSVQTPDFTLKFRLRKFAIPLAPNGAPPMPVGYLKRLTPSKKTIRRRGKR